MKTNILFRSEEEPQSQCGSLFSSGSVKNKSIFLEYWRTITTVLFTLLLFGNTSWAQNIAANIDQGNNGGVGEVPHPIAWVNGNLGPENTHLLEGFSVPYRAIVTNLTVGQQYTIVIGIDTRDQSKAALDYFTSYQRLISHAQFGHPEEFVDPLLGLSGTFSGPTFRDIPVPGTAGTPVAGMPASSFNNLPVAQRQIAIWNGTIPVGGITYALQESLGPNIGSSKTNLSINFTATASTVVFAWGGHVASNAANEWNGGAHPGGSPYHCRIVGLGIFGGTLSGGSQDRSLKSSAVLVPPVCNATGSASVCGGSSNIYSTTTTDQATYLWSFTNNTSGAQIVGSATGSSVTVSSGTGPGSYTIQVVVTKGFLSSTPCFVTTAVNDNPTATAGPDETKCQTAPSGPTSFTLAGTASNGTSQWSQVGQTGTAQANVATPGSPTSTVSVAGIGTVTLRLTSTSNTTPPCGTATDDVVLTVNPPVVTNAGPDQNKCASSPNVTLAGSVSGGATTGTWSGGAGTFNPNANALNAVYTPSAAEIAAGTVTLTLTSANPAGPCDATSDTMVITIYPAVVTNAGPDQSKCASIPAVTLAGSVSGGTTTGTWSGGTGTFNPNANALNAVYTPSAVEIPAAGTAPITVTLTLTSANPAGPCDATSDTMVITVNPLPAITCPAPRSRPVQCGVTVAAAQLNTNTEFNGWLATFGYNAAIYSVVISYEKSVDNGPYAPIQASGVPPLNPLAGHAVAIRATWTLTDINTGCVNSCSSIFTLSNGCQPGCTTDFTNLTCNGNNSGTITVTVGGGTPPYTATLFLSSDLVNPIVNPTNPGTGIAEGGTHTFTGLAAGNYVVISTDIGHTIATGGVCTATVTQPTILTASSSKTDVVCNGQSNGTLTAAGAAGSPGYTYAISGPANTSGNATGAYTGLAAGTYTVTVTDTHLCTATTTQTIGQPTLLTASSSKTDVACIGGSNGTLTAAGAGGSPGYTYAISGPANTSGNATGAYTGLAAGTYTVTVTDTHLCTATTTQTISVICTTLPVLTCPANQVIQGAIYPATGCVDLGGGGVATVSGAFSNLPPLSNNKVDFRQPRNQGHPTTPLDWVNGINNSTQAEYFEGMGVPQRIIFTQLVGTTHVFRFRHEVVKHQSGDRHAYDFLMSWEQAVATAASIGNGALNELQNLIAQTCNEGISATPYDACANFTTSRLATLTDNMGNPPNHHGNNTVNNAIAGFEGQYGNRQIEIKGSAPFTAFAIAFEGYEGTAAGDNYAWYTITWTSTSPAVMIKFAGRAAPGAGLHGYGACYGAGDINGGPYHFKLDKLDSSSLGNRDNQVFVDFQPCTVDIPVTFGTPTATACNNTTPTVAVINSDVITVNADGSKTHCRTWRATDNCDNSDTCSQCITVTCVAIVGKSAPGEAATSNVQSEIAGFDVYPVPFKDQLTIRYNFDYKTDVKIVIFDMLGRVLMTYDDKEAYFGKEVTLHPKFTKDTEGTYFIKVFTNKGYETKKIISGK